MSHLITGKRFVALLAVAGMAAAAVLVTSSPAGATTSTLVTLKSVSPSVGSTGSGAAVGDTVTLTGKGFLNVVESTPGNVTFGGVAVTSFLAVTDTQIVARLTATAASYTAGLAAITITDSTGNTATLTGKFTFYAPITAALPTTVNLSPLGGGLLTVPVTAGSAGASSDIFKTLKITGKINNLAAVATYMDANDVYLKVPAGVASGTAVPVRVDTFGVAGVADTVNAKYAAIITKMSVTSSSTTGVAASTKPAITITGKGLLGATVFLFGATPVVGSCTVVSDISVTCTDIPAHAAGPVTVTFTTATGPAGITAAATFTYVDVV